MFALSLVEEAVVALVVVMVLEGDKQFSSILVKNWVQVPQTSIFKPKCQK